MTDPPFIGAIARRRRAPLPRAAARDQRRTSSRRSRSKLERLRNPLAHPAAPRARRLRRSARRPRRRDRRHDAAAARGEGRAAGADPGDPELGRHAPRAPRAARQRLGARARGSTKRFVVMHSGNVGHAQDLDTLIRALHVPARPRRPGRSGSSAAAPAARSWSSSRERLEAEKVALPGLPAATSCCSQSLSTADIHVVGLARGLAGYVVPSRLYGDPRGRPAGDRRGRGRERDRAAGRASVGCGVVVPPGDPFALARAIRAAHDGEFDLAEMGSARARLRRGGGRPRDRDRPLRGRALGAGARQR